MTWGCFSTAFLARSSKNRGRCSFAASAYFFAITSSIPMRLMMLVLASLISVAVAFGSDIRTPCWKILSRSFARCLSCKGQKFIYWRVARWDSDEYETLKPKGHTGGWWCEITLFLRAILHVCDLLYHH